jgi:hypothetical protein
VKKYEVAINSSTNGNRSYYFKPIDLEKEIKKYTDDKNKKTENNLKNIESKLEQ